jgi:hypothetical protein
MVSPSDEQIILEELKGIEAKEAEAAKLQSAMELQKQAK